MKLVVFCSIAVFWGVGPGWASDLEGFTETLRQGNVQAVIEILDKDPELVHSDLGNGTQPLHLAASTGHGEVVGELIARKADINVRDGRGNTALHHAASNGHLDTVDLLLKHGMAVDIPGHHNGSPLFFAVFRGHLDVIRLLIDKGADVTMRDEFEDTPVFYAVYGRQAESIDLLCEFGADLHVKNRTGRTPLHLAAGEGLLPVAEGLIRNKAPVSARDDQGLTPLHLSAFAGKRRMAELLIKKGADANAKSNGLDTPLHGAAYSGHPDVVDFLLAQGADPNAKNDQGIRPLDYAIQRGHDANIEALKLRGAKASEVASSPQRAAKSQAVSDARALPSHDFTILYDNYVLTEGTRADWGFACLIETEDHTILFDTGLYEATLAANVEALEVDVQKIDQIVISHDHGDHTGGLFWVLNQNADVTVFLPHSMPFDFVRRVEATGAIVSAERESIQIAPHFFLTGEMGSEIMEQSLIFDRIQDLVVVTGCSHPGIVEIVTRAAELRGKKVELVFGGFHMMQASNEQLGQIVEAFQDLGLHRCGASHCTGDHAIDYFRSAFGENFVDLGTGKKMQFTR